MDHFDLFTQQARLFENAAKKLNPPVWFPPLRGKHQKDEPGNWFICFVPESWGQWKGANYGVHFEFGYGKKNPRTKLPARFRLNVGVEKFLKDELRQSFKETVITRARRVCISEAGFELQAKYRTKLLELDPIPPCRGAWKRAAEGYKYLRPVTDIIGEVVREYYEAGAFEAEMSFSSG